MNELRNKLDGREWVLGWKEVSQVDGEN
jgi:hypothetical protein